MRSRQPACQGSSAVNAAAPRWRASALPTRRNRRRDCFRGENSSASPSPAPGPCPELLFLDEPTSQLDPAATRQIEELLAGLVAEGITVVMSTHDLGQAKRLASRVLFLHRGRLIEDAAAADFFPVPTSPEARAFIAGELLW